MAYCKISSTVLISLSGGACRTMMTEPIRHMAHPSLPSVPKSSFKKYAPNTAPIKTLSAPKGVTRIAGAKAYAAKFATSPQTMVMMPAHQTGLFRYANPSPSKPCLSPASMSPFLVITKLVPIIIVERMANARPTYLSSIMMVAL